MSFCFIEASNRYRTGKPENLTKQQYFDYAIKHLQGARHPGDEDGLEYYKLMIVDPWLASMRDVAILQKYTPIEARVAEQWLHLLDSSSNGDLSAFDSGLQCMGSPIQPDPIEPAASLAAQNGHFQILRYCIEKGVKFNRTVSEAAFRGANSVENLQYLYEQNWRKIRTSHEDAMKQIKVFGRESWQGKWLKDNALPPDYKEVDPRSRRPPDFRSKDEKGRWTAEQVAEWDKDIPW